MMKYLTFRDKVRNYPVFRSNLLEHLGESPNLLRRQITDWIKKRYIIALKRGVYTLRPEEQGQKFSPFFLANYLYRPSYISLETALSYYHIIPERVYTITSVSSKKTQNFENAYGQFTYQHIKPELYGDFIEEKDEFGQTFFIATKERALIDFFYFKVKSTKISEDIFESSYRFQNINDINKKKLITISKQFNNKKIMHLTKLLLNALEDNNVRNFKK